MSQPAKNGRVLRSNNPEDAALKEAIIAEQQRHREKGEKYPYRYVDSYYDAPFAWLGHVPYDTETYERLELTAAAKYRPVRLADEYVIDGESRLPGESQQAYTAYLTFRDLATKRTISAVAKATGKNAANLAKIASRWRWNERVAAWDAAMEAESVAMMQRLVDDQQREHIERRQTYLNNEHDVITKAIGRIKEMLDLPLIGKRTIEEDGRTINVWEPAKWTYASLSQLLGEIDKIARLHFGMSTSNASQKIEATITGDMGGTAHAMSADEQRAHDYASRKAEEAYFAALAEYQQAHNEPDHMVAQLVAD